jgi:hypothetical protein
LITSFFSGYIVQIARLQQHGIASESPKTPERRAQMPNFLSLSIRQAAVNAYHDGGPKNLRSGRELG